MYRGSIRSTKFMKNSQSTTCINHPQNSPQHRLQRIRNRKTLLAPGWAAGRQYAYWAFGCFPQRWVIWEVSSEAVSSSDIAMLWCSVLALANTVSTSLWVSEFGCSILQGDWFGNMCGQYFGLESAGLCCRQAIFAHCSFTSEAHSSTGSTWNTHCTWRTCVPSCCNTWW